MTVKRIGIIILMLQISLTHAQTPVAPTYSPDFLVHTMLTMGDTVILGGDFRHMGVYTGGGAAFPLGSNTPNLGFPKFIGSISASCPDGQGGVYVAGRFAKETEPSSNPINRIEHVRADGSFNPDFSIGFTAVFTIQSLVQYQGILYVGGWGLTAIEQQPAGNLAGIRISNKQLVTHLPALSANAKVDRLRVIGNSLYVMGSFTTIGNEARTNLAAIDLHNGSIKPWNPSAALTNFSQRGFVDVIPYQNRVIIGGNFSMYNNQEIYWLHSAALTDTIMGSNLQFLFRSAGLFGNNNCLYHASEITAMALDGDNLYAFSRGTDDTRVTAINLANHNTINCTRRWTKYFNMTAKARDMFVHEGSLYIGGESFTNLYRTNLPNEDAAFERQIKGLVRLNTATGDYQPWTADPVGLVWRDVRTMCRSGNQLFAGGTFSHVNGLDRAGIAMIKASTQQVLPFAPPPFINHTVRSLKAMGNFLYVGGSFPWLGYTNTNKLGFTTDVPFDKSVVSFSLQTGEMQPFSVPAFERDGTVQALEADQVNLYVGGNFTVPVGNGRQHLIAVNRQSGAIQNWAPNPNFEVAALQITGNRLFAGGTFSNIAGQPRQRVAAFTLPALTLDSFRTAPSWNVQAIRSVLGTLWLSGSFTQINNTNASLFAGINLTNGQLKNRPYPGFVGSWANALLSAGCKVIAAGNFTPNFNQPCNNLAVYDVFSQQLESACVSFESGGSIHALARIGNDVYLGGNFIKLNGKANATYFHRLRFPAGYFSGCASFVTQNAGKWHDPTTWRGGMVPPQDARVTVRHLVTVEQDVRCFSIQVQQGGNVSVNPGIRFEVVN